MDENTDIMTMTFTYADNTQATKQLLSIFTAENGRQYAAMRPLDDKGRPTDEATELYRAKPITTEDGEADYEIEEILSEVELETAIQGFNALLVPDTLPVEDPPANKDADENDDGETISFRSEDGKYHKCKKIDAFEHKDRQYIALMPLETDGMSEVSISIMRMSIDVQGGVECINVEDIPSDMEFDDVVSIFEKRVDAANSIHDAY
ncbi:hypothetical protein OBV_p-00670 (plasmid) [Oscillibacter valericigenes Sjm18-20]|nr:hypothetical protein OBV_p-00670 [Oscillibacter valericigenes Sjm18-20]